MERDTREIRKGDIFYIQKAAHVGSEMISDGRPAIIVSNDYCNQHSEVVEVVFLTTRAKHRMPTHVFIASAPRPSTALCEQITSVSKQRITEFAGRITKEEMMRMERAMMISLDVQYGIKERLK